jgi:hypothetical protein
MPLPPTSRSPPLSSARARGGKNRTSRKTGGVSCLPPGAWRAGRFLLPPPLFLRARRPLPPWRERETSPPPALLPPATPTPPSPPRDPRAFLECYTEPEILISVRERGGLVVPLSSAPTPLPPCARAAEDKNAPPWRAAPRAALSRCVHATDAGEEGEGPTAPRWRARAERNVPSAKAARCSGPDALALLSTAPPLPLSLLFHISPPSRTTTVPRTRLRP